MLEKPYYLNCSDLELFAFVTFKYMYMYRKRTNVHIIFHASQYFKRFPYLIMYVLKLYIYMYHMD